MDNETDSADNIACEPTYWVTQIEREMKQCFQWAVYV